MCAIGAHIGRTDEEPHSNLHISTNKATQSSQHRKTIRRYVTSTRQLSYLILWIYVAFNCFSPIQGQILYFEVKHPDSLRYSFMVQKSRDIGGNFTRMLRGVSLVYADPPISCSPLTNGAQVAGNVVMVERGECSFVTKGVNAEAAGALIVIVTQSTKADEQLVDMVNDETGRKINIPALYLPGHHGRILRRHFLYGQSSILIDIPLNLTNVPLDAVRLPPWELW